MPSYPIEPDKLLVAANKLAPRAAPRGRPSYTAHRRAVSTAYYAVFHALNARAVEQAFPTGDTVFRQRVQRWLGHADAARVCGWISTIMGTGTHQTPAHIRTLLDPPGGGGPHIDQTTLNIADGFLELYTKRQEADYDHEVVFTRSGTRGLIVLADDVVKLIANATSDEAQLFFSLIAMQSQARAR